MVMRIIVSLVDFKL